MCTTIQNTTQLLNITSNTPVELYLCGNNTPFAFLDTTKIFNISQNLTIYAKINNNIVSEFVTNGNTTWSINPITNNNQINVPIIIASVLSCFVIIVSTILFIKWKFLKNKNPLDFMTHNPDINKEFTVIENYKPFYEDELSVIKGDLVKIEEIFKDGWCKIIKQNGEQGVVPLKCINKK